MVRIKVLYVEDEPSLAGIVADTLQHRGYDVHLVDDGAQVMEQARAFAPDICVLDVMLPNRDGFSIGKELNRDLPDLPIIFLTARSSSNDVITGFRSGGKDYLKKPFSMEELMVRMENLLELSGKKDAVRKKEFVIGNYVFDAHNHLLRIDDVERKLSYKEVELFKFLAQRKNDVVVKKEILLAVWGDDSYYNSRNLDVYMRKIRAYLSGDPRISIITLRGVGYRFIINDE